MTQDYKMTIDVSGLPDVHELAERCVVAEGKVKKLQELVWEYELERAEMATVVLAARDLGQVDYDLTNALNSLDKHYLENG